MTKEKLKSTEALVKEILEVDEVARGNDNFLYLRVLFNVAKHKGYDLWEVSVPRFLMSSNFYGYPPFETVRRSRQKLQRKFPELRANKEVTEQRADNETAYRQFVREEVCS
ncbi:MAG: hypothetical protein U0K91_07175 [Acutalibacteraceae bacterium]|nr:hypothetical protein [Acutalibacteraceae bacterium]